MLDFFLIIKRLELYVGDFLSSAKVIFSKQYEGDLFSKQYEGDLFSKQYEELLNITWTLWHLRHESKEQQQVAMGYTEITRSGVNPSTSACICF